jgi:hypothetical protein
MDLLVTAKASVARYPVLDFKQVVKVNVHENPSSRTSRGDVVFRALPKCGFVQYTFKFDLLLMKDTPHFVSYLIHVYVYSLLLLCYFPNSETCIKLRHSNLHTYYRKEVCQYVFVCSIAKCFLLSKFYQFY